MDITKSINNENLTVGNNKKLLILHHTASKASLTNNVKYLNRWDYISAHFIVGKKGEIVQLVDDDRVAFHAGLSSWKGIPSKWGSLNWCSIGIEVNSDGYEFTDAQRRATKELIQSLMTKYGIPSELVLRHKDIAPKRKIDVGDNYWNTDYKSWKDYQTSLTLIPSWAEETVKTMKDAKIETDPNTELKSMKLYHLLAIIFKFVKFLK